jgi:hypothetical protein
MTIHHDFDLVTGPEDENRRLGELDLFLCGSRSGSGGGVGSGFACASVHNQNHAHEHDSISQFQKVSHSVPRQVLIRAHFFQNNTDRLQ